MYKEESETEKEAEKRMDMNVIAVVYKNIYKANLMVD